VAEDPSSQPASERIGEHAGGGRAQRVVFIDLARTLAVVLMLYGHTVTALLAPEYRAGTWYDIWQFQRGLTSCLFLLLSGFAFSIATARHWSSHQHLSRRVVVRTRRFLLFVFLGYMLHFPVATFGDLAHATDVQWRSFLAVDVLQLIGTTFVVVQLLVAVTRSRAVFAIAALALALAIVAVTPRVSATDWTWLPLGIASYFTEATGSLFPWFPWSAYILLGAAMGQLHGRWSGVTLATFASAALLAPGALMVPLGIGLQGVAPRLFGDTPANFVPPQFLIRAGACLLIVGAIAHASRFIARLPPVFAAVAQETLVIYFVHLCIVYGSPWNVGLFQLFGPTLSPWLTAAVVLALVVSMSMLAWQWNWLKRVWPGSVRWAVAIAGIVLLVRLM
jgi:uncharacterized membrane protein